MARRSLGPASLTVVQAVQASLTETDTTLLCACSGGPDSLALAFGVVTASRARRVDCAAVVVDHGLQPDSGRVAAEAVRALTGLGFADVETVRVHVSGDGSGPEAAARTARYAALDRAAAARSATLLLGHTLDDQAETVLLGLARGSGPRSLAGMATRDGHRVRPLVGLRREVTAGCCAELRLVPWRDPHNADPGFTRVRVRDRALPVLEAELGPGIADALARTADLARADADLLDALAFDAAAEVATAAGDLDCVAAAALPGPLRTRVLVWWLRERGAADLAQPHVRAVDALLTDWHGQGPVHLPHVQVTRTAGVLHTLSPAGHSEPLATGSQ